MSICLHGDMFTWGGIGLSLKRRSHLDRNWPISQQKYQWYVKMPLHWLITWDKLTTSLNTYKSGLRRRVLRKKCRMILKHVLVNVVRIVAEINRKWRILSQNSTLWGKEGEVLFLQNGVVVDWSVYMRRYGCWPKNCIFTCSEIVSRHLLNGLEQKICLFKRFSVRSPGRLKYLFWFPFVRAFAPKILVQRFAYQFAINWKCHVARQS